jgi:hypothetical protein
MKFPAFLAIKNDFQCRHEGTVNCVIGRGS